MFSLVEPRKRLSFQNPSILPHVFLITKPLFSGILIFFSKLIPLANFKFRKEVLGSIDKVVNNEREIFWNGERKRIKGQSLSSNKIRVKVDEATFELWSSVSGILYYLR